MNAFDFEKLVRSLAVAIDPDEPIGMAAGNLARAIVALVRDRGGKEAVLLEGAVNELAKRYPRNSTAPEMPTPLSEPPEQKERIDPVGHYGALVCCRIVLRRFGHVACGSPQLFRRTDEMLGELLQRTWDVLTPAERELAAAGSPCGLEIDAPHASAQEPLQELKP